MEKEQHTTHYKTAEILEFYTLQNSWMATRKLIAIQWNMFKNNTSVFIQERARLNVSKKSKNLTICSLMVVFELMLRMNNDR